VSEARVLLERVKAAMPETVSRMGQGLEEGLDALVGRIQAGRKRVQGNVDKVGRIDV